MDCNNVSGHLIDYIDGKLSPSVNTEIEKHLKECAACNLAYQQTKEMFTVYENIPLKEPGAGLKKSFEEMLKKEKALLRQENQRGAKTIRMVNYKILWQVAAAVLLLITGYLAGYNSNDNSKNTDQVAKMQQDLNEMKQQMQAINLLKNESASQRIKAVNYTEEIQEPGSEVIEALINTLESDPSSNVRLAAVYSLARFKTNPTVKEAFINTLNKQDDPMVQIVIINLLVEMEEVKAVDEMKKLLNKKDLHKEVKSQAELGVKILS